MESKDARTAQFPLEVVEADRGLRHPRQRNVYCVVPTHHGTVTGGRSQLRAGSVEGILNPRNILTGRFRPAGHLGEPFEPQPGALNVVCDVRLVIDLFAVSFGAELSPFQLGAGNNQAGHLSVVIDFADGRKHVIDGGQQLGLLLVIEPW